MKKKILSMIIAIVMIATYIPNVSANGNNGNKSSDDKSTIHIKFVSNNKDIIKPNKVNDLYGYIYFSFVGDINGIDQVSSPVTGFEDATHFISLDTTDDKNISLNDKSNFSEDKIIGIQLFVKNDNEEFTVNLDESHMVSRTEPGNSKEFPVIIGKEDGGNGKGTLNIWIYFDRINEPDGGTPGGGDDNGTPGGGDDNGTPGGGDDNGTPGDGDDNGTPGDGDDNGTPGDGDDNGTPGDGDDNGTPGGETGEETTPPTITPIPDEVPLSPGNSSNTSTESSSVTPTPAPSMPTITVVETQTPLANPTVPTITIQQEQIPQSGENGFAWIGFMLLLAAGGVYVGVRRYEKSKIKE